MRSIRLSLVGLLLLVSTVAGRCAAADSCTKLIRLYLDTSGTMDARLGQAEAGPTRKEAALRALRALLESQAAVTSRPFADSGDEIEVFEFASRVREVGRATSVDEALDLLKDLESGSKSGRRETDLLELIGHLSNKPDLGRHSRYIAIVASDFLFDPDPLLSAEQARRQWKASVTTHLQSLGQLFEAGPRYRLGLLILPHTATEGDEADRFVGNDFPESLAARAPVRLRDTRAQGDSGTNVERLANELAHQILYPVDLEIRGHPSGPPGARDFRFTNRGCFPISVEVVRLRCEKADLPSGSDQLPGFRLGASDYKSLEWSASGLDLSSKCWAQLYDSAESMIPMAEVEWFLKDGVELVSSTHGPRYTPMGCCSYLFHLQVRGQLTQPSSAVVTVESSSGLSEPLGIERILFTPAAVSSAPSNRQVKVKVGRRAFARLQAGEEQPQVHLSLERVGSPAETVDGEARSSATGEPSPKHTLDHPLFGLTIFLLSWLIVGKPFHAFELAHAGHFFVNQVDQLRAWLRVPLSVSGLLAMVPAGLTSWWVTPLIGSPGVIPPGWVLVVLAGCTAFIALVALHFGVQWYVVRRLGRRMRRPDEQRTWRQRLDEENAVAERLNRLGWIRPFLLAGVFSMSLYGLYVWFERSAAVPPASPEAGTVRLPETNEAQTDTDSH